MTQALSTIRKGDIFYLPTAECVVAPAMPYTVKVLRPHRDVGYFECVYVSGGHPAQHNSIHVHSCHEIMRLKADEDMILESAYEAKLHADELAHDRYLDSLEYDGCPHARSVTQFNGEGAFCRDCGETVA